MIFVMKKMNIKVLLFVMVLSIITSVVPINVFAYQSYTTNTGDTWYGEIDGNTQHQATTAQTTAITNMKNRALYSWALDANYPSHTSYWYYAKPNDTSEENRIYLYNTETYRGVLYEMRGYSTSDPSYMGSRENWLKKNSNVNEVQNVVDTMINNNCRYVKGLDCSSASCYAWRSTISNISNTNGTLMRPNSYSNGVFHRSYTSQSIIHDGNCNTSSNGGDYGAYVNRVGQYGQYADSLSEYTDDTCDIIGNLMVPGNYQGTGTIYSRVYDKINAGDFLVYRVPSDENSNTYVAHTMLVKKVVIVYNNDNSINEYQSYVLANEQTSKKKTCTNLVYPSGNQTYITTWRLGYDGNNGVKYTFYEMANRFFYLPYRFHGQAATMVTGFVPEQQSKTSINVKWYPQGAKNIDGYELYYADNEDFINEQKVVFENPNSSSVILDNLNKDTKYFIRMRAYRFDEKGNKKYSCYNHWVSIDLKTGAVYREGAPSTKDVSEKEYNEYIYDDICIDHTIPDDDIE